MTEIEWTHIPGYTGATWNLALDAASAKMGAASSGADNTGKPLTTRASEALMATGHRTLNHRHLQTRDRNPNWRGGKIVASNGYVLVRVGVDHHLADVRGYAYEHRIVAEAKIGRRLLPGEVVHHIDGDKQNNLPSNLEVHASIADHLAEHRKPGCDRRLPGENNPLIQCACGCGMSFHRYDNYGRPRRFASGHNNGGRASA